MEDNKAILERVRDEYAKDKEYEDWIDYVKGGRIDTVDVENIAEAYHQYKLKQETQIETPWDWFGWLQARIPNLESKHKLWIQQCVQELVNAKLKQLAPSDEEDFICDLMNHLPSYLNQGLSLRIAIKKHIDKFINPEK